jgi:hypothetical protein
VQDGGSDAAAVLEGVSPSDRWDGVRVHAGGSGIVVERRGDPSGWLCDLWLAERLADQL